MKAKVFFLALIITFPLYICAANSSGGDSEEDISTDTLFFMGGKMDFYLVGNVIHFKLAPPEELVFTGDDIEYFNLETEEIVFYKKSFVVDSLTNSYKIYSMYNIYLNNKLLFENVPCLWPISSWVYNETVLYNDWDKLYLNDGYPWAIDGVLYNGLTTDNVRKLREENAEKHKTEWDIFIKYLNDAGKIVKGTGIAKPRTTPELNAISVFPNPTKGELRMENGKLRMDNVQIFDIFGKQLLILNSQFSILNSIDISHLPAGTYFVQITTEKGVVTKKVVKL